MSRWHRPWWRRPRPPERPPPGTVLAEARGVTAGHGARTVLSDVDLQIAAGEVVALVGPNGAGKSTLVSVLAGDLPTSAGAVELYGEPLVRWSLAEQAMRRAVLPQHHLLSFPFTVTAVVQMGRAPWTGTAAEADDAAAVAEAMAAADVAALAGRSFQTLSGGERARVALARVLAQRAGLLLLDEPTAALDLHHQEVVLGVARARAAAGDAVGVVLHDLALAAGYTDRVAVLAGGRVVATGPPADVFTSRLLSEVWQHPVEVLAHPRTGAPLVLPVRAQVVRAQVTG